MCEPHARVEDDVANPRLVGDLVGPEQSLRVAPAVPRSRTISRSSGWFRTVSAVSPRNAATSWAVTRRSKVARSSDAGGGAGLALGWLNRPTVRGSGYSGSEEKCRYAKRLPATWSPAGTRRLAADPLDSVA